MVCSRGEPLRDATVARAGARSVRGVRIHPVLALRRRAGWIIVFRLAGATGGCGVAGRSGGGGLCARRGRGGRGGGSWGRCGSRRSGCRRGGSWSGVYCGRRRRYAAMTRASAASALRLGPIGARDHRRTGGGFRGLLCSRSSLGIDSAVAGASAATGRGSRRSIGADRAACCLRGCSRRNCTERGKSRRGDQVAHTHGTAPEEVARETGEVQSPGPSHCISHRYTASRVCDILRSQRNLRAPRRGRMRRTQREKAPSRSAGALGAPRIPMG